MVRRVITAIETTEQTARRKTLYTTYYPFKAENLTGRGFASTKSAHQKTRYFLTRSRYYLVLIWAEKPVIFSKD